MRALRPLLLLFLPAATGCVWTQFDELRDDVWVDSVDAIEGSAKYGEAVMDGNAMATSTSGGTTIGVLGRNNASVSFLVYTADGKRSIKRVDIGNSFMLVSVLDENPVYAADPDGDQIAVAALTGALTEQPSLRGIKIGLFRSGAGVDMGEGVNPGFEPNAFPEDSVLHEQPTGLAFGGGLDVLLGRKGQLAHVDLAGTPGAWTGCRLTDPNEAPYAIAYGDVDGVAGNEWIIASAPAGVDVAPDPGRVWIIPDTAIPADTTGTAPCPAPTKEVTSSGISIPLGAGSQIAIAPADFGAGPRVLVSTPGAGGKISVVDFTAATAEFSQIATPGVAGLDSFEVADITGDATSELIIGAPLADQAGETRAGVVRILDPAGMQVAEPLFDADAQTEQHYGKSVAVVPFGDQKVLVVGSEGEVFTYFRTSFYDEVRSGR